MLDKLVKGIQVICLSCLLPQFSSFTYIFPVQLSISSNIFLTQNNGKVRVLREKGEHLNNNDDKQKGPSIPEFAGGDNIPQLNTVLLTGRLGADPKPSYFDDGKCVVNASLAVKRNYHSLERKALGIRFGEEETDWFQLELWSQQAELALKLLSKGMRIGVTGSLQLDTWKGSDENERLSTKVLVRSFELLESKAEKALREDDDWQPQKLYDSKSKVKREASSENSAWHEETSNPLLPSFFDN